MKRVLLYNFAEYRLPDGLDEALSLLGLYTVYNHTARMWHIYQMKGRERFTWAGQVFVGGSMEDWVKFLTNVCANEHRT